MTTIPQVPPPAGAESVGHRRTSSGDEWRPFKGTRREVEACGGPVEIAICGEQYGDGRIEPACPLDPRALRGSQGSYSSRRASSVIFWSASSAASTRDAANHRASSGANQMPCPLSVNATK